MSKSLTIWKKGAVICQITGIEPRLASWDHSNHPSQIKLRGYLDDLKARVGPLPSDSPLYLDLCVDIQQPERLLVNCDLENYLTPLFGRLAFDAGRFPLVSASKRARGGSTLTIGIAEISEDTDSSIGWNHFSYEAHGSTQKKEWKESIRTALAATQSAVLPNGPVDVQVALGVSPRRNWVMLWKPVGDTMGPVLGEEKSFHAFHPRDDRIVNLAFHRTIDSELGNAVAIDLWWWATISQ